MQRLLLLAVAAVLALAPATLRVGSAYAITNCSAPTGNDSEELAFLALINNYRAQNGLGRLSISVNLSRAAHWKATDLGTKNYFSHTDSLGRSPWVLSVDCGYPVAGGENLAAGTNQSSAASAFALFRGSPEHNANMLRPDYLQIGIARVYVPGSTYGWYWATEFGTVDDTAPPPPPTPRPPAPHLVAAANPAPTQAPAPSPVPAAVAPASIALDQAPPCEFSVGATLFTWQGPDVSVAPQFQPPTAPRLIYSFDRATGEWHHSGVDVPAFLVDFTQLEHGQAYWEVTLPPVG